MAPVSLKCCYAANTINCPSELCLAVPLLIVNNSAAARKTVSFVEIATAELYGDRSISQTNYNYLIVRNIRE